MPGNQLPRQQREDTLEMIKEGIGSRRRKGESYRGEENRGAEEKRATINRTVVMWKGREDEKDEPHTLLTTENKAFIHHGNN